MSGVDLRGEMRHWAYGASMRDAGDGWFQSELRLGPGVYEYKFRVADDRWLLDPANPRTRARDGVRNSVLVVEGTDEPLLHAPARPYAFVEDDGRLCIRAALRRGAADPAGVCIDWDEGSGPRRTPMRVVGDEDEHALLEAHLPGGGRAVSYVFALADGRLIGAPGGGAQAFQLPIALVQPRAPQWWRDAVLYSIFVDRFRRGGTGGRWRDTSVTGRQHRAGGDLDGIVDALPYLTELGVTALHLTPICRAPSVHRYDSVDPRSVAPELGGEAALSRLLRAAHQRGVRVLLDIAITHVHRDFFAFRDVAERGRSSPYWSWFSIYRHPFATGYRPGYEHYQKGQWQEPLLRTEEPEVQSYLVETFAHWARLGADGFRIDAAADAPLELVRRITAAVRAENRDAVVIGEVIPSHIHRWTADAVDAATDFERQELVRDWLWRGRVGAARLAEVTARRRFSRGAPGWSAIAFAGTHDQPRVRTLTADARAARLALLHALTGAPVPMLYYGDEVGLASDEPRREFEDSWPDRQCMPWRRDGWDEQTLAMCRRAIALRRAHPALSRGDERALDVGNEDVCAFRRWHGGEVIDVLLHRGDRRARLRLDGDAPARVLLAVGDTEIEDGGTVALGPWSALVVDRREPPSRVDDAVHDNTRALAELAFRAGLVESPVLPASLYVTVTEACNLQCRHCITRAPELTRERRARQLQPWLLDALADAFAAADYVGFSHGGESLAAPIFFDVLRAIGRARHRIPGRCDVHLLTNGTLLDGDTTRRLIDGGVTSLMISLDGASAMINDAIRVGGRFDDVVANVREAVRIREQTRADLRLGLSTVVGRTNLRGLPDLARLAIELGVDWLKLEETYPATPFARHDLLDPGDASVRAAAEEVESLLRAAGLVFVDHLDPPTGCACDPDAEPTLRAFRAADDFANRTRFSPCRAAWEQACIDPDGTVRPVDYAHPPLGNLLDAPLFELWNGPTVRGVRARALANPSCRASGHTRRAIG